MSSNRTSSSTFGAALSKTASLCYTAAKRALPLSIAADVSYCIRRCFLFQYILFKFEKTADLRTQTENRKSRLSFLPFTGGRSPLSENFKMKTAEHRSSTQNYGIAKTAEESLAGSGFDGAEVYL
jgi:hypothetical protein